MNNLMLDLESMAKNTSAPIVSIAAVFFEPATGEIGSQFYTNVKLDSEMVLGAVPDADTIIWWMKQSSEARAAITSDQVIPVSEALFNLSDFVVANCEQPKYLKVWGNGASFDNVILRGAYERCGMPPCWNWFNDRDVRTIVELGRAIGFDPKHDLPFDGERHNALADAIHQAKYVSAIWQRLLAPHQE